MAANLIPKFLTVPAISKHTATIIFIHGLGDSGHGWHPVAEMFSEDSELNHVKWVLPHAPQRAVTANMGMKMPAWFDIYSFNSVNAKEDEKGMLESSATIQHLIDTEVKDGIDPSRIVLGGFSQGAAMTYLTGLTGKHKLGGLVALSGRIPLQQKLKEMINEKATSVPFFIGHGSDDPLIGVERAHAAAKYLEENFNFKVKEDSVEEKSIAFHIYQGLPHSINDQEQEDLKSWLKRVIPKASNEKL